jgi:4-amino-4-deoxy-L-arabinose transferase-like glycosyltransferase
MTPVGGSLRESVTARLSDPAAAYGERGARSRPSVGLVAFLKAPGSAAWAILAFALLIRAVAAIAGTHHFATTFLDSWDYDRYGHALAFGHRFPDSFLTADGGPSAYRPPVFPLFLGAVYVLPGRDLIAGLAAQAALGTVVVALIGVLTWQVWGRRTALVAMGVAAVSPPLIVLGVSLLSEPLYLVFELGAISAAVAHRRSSHPYRWALVTGLLAGLAVLTRVNGILLVVPLAIAVWTLRPRFGGVALAQPALMVGATLVLLAPWTIRNAIELHAFIPLSTQDGIALERSFNPIAFHASPPSLQHNSPRLFRIKQQHGINEAELSSELEGAARNFMREHPAYVAQTAFWNFIRLFHLSDPELGRGYSSGEGVDWWLSGLGIYGLYPLALLALAGALLPAARRAPWFVWVAPALAWLPVLLMATGRARYRAPIDPFLVMLAGLALVAAWERLSRPHAARRRPHSV